MLLELEKRAAEFRRDRHQWRVAHIVEWVALAVSVTWAPLALCLP